MGIFKEIFKMKNKDKIDWKVVVVGIAALTTIEVAAMAQGINGVLLSSIIGIIALSIGIAIPSPIK